MPTMVDTAFSESNTASRCLSRRPDKCFMAASRFSFSASRASNLRCRSANSTRLLSNLVSMSRRSTVSMSTWLRRSPPSPSRLRMALLSSSISASSDACFFFAALSVSSIISLVNASESFSFSCSSSASSCCFRSAAAALALVFQPSARAAATSSDLARASAPSMSSPHFLRSDTSSAFSASRSRSSCAAFSVSSSRSAFVLTKVAKVSACFSRRLLRSFNNCSRACSNPMSCEAMALRSAANAAVPAASAAAAWAAACLASAA
mmetsp:Transcript_37858/g.93758  ORF Transcript_37858/g.93758 Transcript_37858/m.93758 type:complete len:264 (-) Transcript_37858:13-804(-)